jgi:DNA-binding MarR family transcriptional regulator
MGSESTHARNRVSSNSPSPGPALTPHRRADDRRALSLLESLTRDAHHLVSKLRRAHTDRYPIEVAPTPGAGSRALPLHRSAFGIRLMLRLRNMRATIFGAPDLFQDPAWDILLDLYAADLEGRPVSVSSACIASMVPASTALRWIKVLENRGLVTRGHDEGDARRRYVFLTQKSRAAIESFLEAVDAGLDEIIAQRTAQT